MTKEDIIRMAHEAGMPMISLKYAEKFAALIAAAEREACAEEIEKVFQQEASMDTMREYVKRIVPYEKAAAVLRARGQDD